MNGLLLINLGTPDEPTPAAVRRYLRQFLSDPRVLDINPIGRWLLLNLIILPTRPKKSAEAYEKVWSERGSPLLYHGLDLAQKVQQRLGQGWMVELGMRYGNPSIESVLQKFEDAGINQPVVFPLFPQYASSSTGSALELVYQEMARRWNTPYPAVVPPFFDEPAFIDAFAAIGRPILTKLGGGSAQPFVDGDDAHHVVFSFHGLPERHIRKGDNSGTHCLSSDDCCSALTANNLNCYRAQCFKTARELAAALSLADTSYTVAFQSRLGRDPWIRPYADETIRGLAAQGVKKLAVYCPAFVADCLETLEEIGMGVNDQFIEAGGEELALIPSLNSDDGWADTVADLAKRHLGAREPETA